MIINIIIIILITIIAIIFIIVIVSRTELLKTFLLTTRKAKNMMDYFSGLNCSETLNSIRNIFFHEQI